MEKMGFVFVQDSCGCDVARKATWQSHAGPCKRMHGTEVTRGMNIYIYL